MGNCNETNGQEQGNMANNCTSTDEIAFSYGGKMRSENEIKDLRVINDRRPTNPEPVDSIIPSSCTEENSPSQQIYRKINGKYGDCTFIDEHGNIIGIGNGL